MKHYADVNYAWICSRNQQVQRNESKFLFSREHWEPLIGCELMTHRHPLITLVRHTNHCTWCCPPQTIIEGDILKYLALSGWDWPIGDNSYKVSFKFCHSINSCMQHVIEKIFRHNNVELITFSCTAIMVLCIDLNLLSPSVYYYLFSCLQTMNSS